MKLLNWGSTPQEVSEQLPGDDVCPNARLVATRSIDLASPPEDVFPWLIQMGFGRAGWYSYDLLDNLGRRSANRVVPEWQDIVEGDVIPGGPIKFRAAVVESPTAFVIAFDYHPIFRHRLCFSLAYSLRPTAYGTRLVTRVRARVDLPFGRLIETYLLGPGDGIMVRRQLLGLARRVGRG